MTWITIGYSGSRAGMTTLQRTAAGEEAWA